MDIGQMAMLNWSTMHLLQIILSKSRCEGFLSWKNWPSPDIDTRIKHKSTTTDFSFFVYFLAILFSMSAQVRWSSYALTHAIFGYHWRSAVRKPMQNENENRNSQQRTKIKLKSHASPSFMVALATSLLIFFHVPAAAMNSRPWCSGQIECIDIHFASSFLLFHFQVVSEQFCVARNPIASSLELSRAHEFDR